MKSKGIKGKVWKEEGEEKRIRKNKEEERKGKKKSGGRTKLERRKN